MRGKLYKLYGINVAVELLRPGAKWEYNGHGFTKWDDERPVPSVEEVNDVMEKIRAFEDSIPTLWTKEQLEKMRAQEEEFERAVG
jgi:hypothetical protein